MKDRKTFFFTWIMAGAAFFSSRAQPGALNNFQLVDLPVARLLPKGEAAMELRVFAGGGLLAGVSVGLSERFNLGAGFGGENIIGAGKVLLFPQPSVHAEYLLFEEQFLSPALVLGFNSQGYGIWDKALKRYTVKSRGLYAVASKNTSFLGGVGLHAGVNWSLEKEDGDKDPNVFLGLHKWINPGLVLLGEYDTAVNDNSDNAIGSGKGYLNAGLSLSILDRFWFELDWKNILQNGVHIDGSSREVKFLYFVQSGS
jgi:hypothetical protein